MIEKVLLAALAAYLFVRWREWLQKRRRERAVREAIKRGVKDAKALDRIKKEIGL